MEKYHGKLAKVLLLCTIIWYNTDRCIMLQKKHGVKDTLFTEVNDGCYSTGQRDCSITRA